MTGMKCMDVFGKRYESVCDNRGMMKVIHHASYCIWDNGKEFKNGKRFIDLGE